MSELPVESFVSKPRFVQKVGENSAIVSINYAILLCFSEKSIVEKKAKVKHTRTLFNW